MSRGHPTPTGDRTLREAIDAGRATAADLADWVDAWHDQPGHKETIWERIGVSKERYMHWLGSEDGSDEALMAPEVR